MLIVFMQMIPTISISGGKPTSLPPLAVVITITMLKDAFEDYQRHQSDANENNSDTKIYDKNQGEFK